MYSFWNRSSSPPVFTKNKRSISNFSTNNKSSLLIFYCYLCQNMTIWLVREISDLIFRGTMWWVDDHYLLFLSNEWSKGNRSQQRYRHRLLLLNLLWQKLRSLLLSFNGAANELELWNYWSPFYPPSLHCFWKIIE